MKKEKSDILLRQEYEPFTVCLQPLHQTESLRRPYIPLKQFLKNGRSVPSAAAQSEESPAVSAPGVGSQNSLSTYKDIA